MSNVVEIDGVNIFENQNGDIIHLDDKNIYNCFELLKTKKIKRISIFTSYIGKPSYNLDNLDVFSGFDLEIDEIIVTSEVINDWSGLYTLKGLKKLSANWLDNIVLDFSKIKKLNSIWIDWNKKQTNLFNLSDLQELQLWKYKPKKFNLDELKKLSSLQTLGIFQSNIQSIKGIEDLSSLKNLKLGYDKDLEILFSDFKKPFNNIEQLHIEVCKKINLDFIKLFPNLKRLKIFNNGKLKSLRPILDGLPKLEEIFIGETIIEESDNEYYKNYPNIKKFFFKEMKHHKLKLNDIGKPY
ncbi:MAG: hypothetical protein ABIP51_04935 [Bacteroidia bacterium]